MTPYATNTTRPDDPSLYTPDDYAQDYYDPDTHAADQTDIWHDMMRAAGYSNLQILAMARERKNHK